MTLKRLLVGGLALLGLTTAVYLTLFQLGATSSVWDPFGLGGSRWILRRSPLAQWLGFPDASLGVVAYALELGLELNGDTDGRRRTWQPLALGAVAAAMAIGGVVLGGLQALYGHWCSLCLVSAAASIGIAALVAPQLRPALQVEVETHRRSDARAGGR